MPRKKIKIKIEDEGRDYGKVFELEEMGAEPAEEWAYRALLAMTANGVEIHDSLLGGGMAALAQFGIQAGEWPKSDIDHKNMDCADNRWTNLREATRAAVVSVMATPSSSSSRSSVVIASKQERPPCR